jgi:hypothetical protein
MWRVLLLLTLLGLTGRGAGAPAPDQPLPATAPVTQQHRLGAVEVSLQADRQTLGIAERLHLHLSVEAPSDMTVTLPPATAKLGPFIVLRQDPSGPLPSAPHRQKWQQAYILEAERTGEQTIPSLSVSFQAAAPNAAPQQLNTEPLTITVTTVLPDEADVTTPKDIAAPVALARRGLSAWVWIALSVLVALACLAGIWWYYRRQRRQAPLPPQPAHVLALQALERLRREELIAQQRVEEYYVRLSDILRRYVEWRFGLRAPEQTTEEFLGAVLATGGLIATHRSLLSTFLQHCDLVKFARHQPSPGDMQQVWESAKGFVEQTSDVQVVVIPAVAEVEVR